MCNRVHVLQCHAIMTLIIVRAHVFYIQLILLGRQSVVQHYMAEVHHVVPVSYTHLTLPTIYSV